MPAKSQAQRALFAIAEHNPSALYARDAGLANLSQSTLHDFAATKTAGLPKKVRKTSSIASMMKRKKKDTGGVS